MRDSIKSSTFTEDLTVNRGKIENGNHDLTSGSGCPQCGQEMLDYNGLLNLACPKCSFEQGGVNT